MNKAKNKANSGNHSGANSSNYKKWLYTVGAFLVLSTSYLIIGEILESIPAELRLSKIFFGDQIEESATLASKRENQHDLKNKSKRNGSSSIRKFPSDEVYIEDLTAAIEEDLWTLEYENQLPNEWFEIADIKHNFHSEWTESVFTKKPIEIEKSAKGNFQLEIEYLDSVDSEDPMLILQMSLINIRTKNKIWELSRPFLLALGKKKPG